MKPFNKYQLEEELKKELNNRKHDHSKYIFYEDFVTIEYIDQFHGLYADWRGYQTEHSIMTGCEKMLEALIAYQCSKVLNDNTNVVGIWTPASAWVGGNWLPRMKEAGLEYFAWVYSPSAMSRVSTDESIKNTEVLDIVKTFDEIEAAKKWLMKDNSNGEVSG